MINGGYGEVEAQLAEEERGAAAIARVAPQPFFHQPREVTPAEGRREAGQRVGRSGEPEQGREAGRAAEGQLAGAHRAVDGLVLGLFRLAGVGEAVDDLARHGLRVGVARQDGAAGQGNGQRAERQVEQGEIDDEPDHAVAPRARVFHDGEGPLAGRRAAKAVEEVGQPVLVEAARREEARGDGQREGDGRGEDEAGRVEREGHAAGRRPARDGPVADDVLEIRGGHLAQLPEREPGEEDEGRQDARCHGDQKYFVTEACWKVCISLIMRTAESRIG